MAEPLSTPSAPTRRGWRARVALGVTGVLLLALLAVMWWWDHEPGPFDVVARAQAHASAHGHRPVTGTTTTSTLVEVARTLLDKRGGYLANDLAPPGALMDNVPNWELGVVLQMRDLARALRDDFSRAQTQSMEDVDLRDAENFFSYKREKWILPSFESGLQGGIEKTESYLTRLGDDRADDAQFYARADNLSRYLESVEKRLGSLSQRLSASVGQQRINTNLGNDPNAQQSTPQAPEQEVRTPWLEIDDVFYEARGSTWALAHFLRAIEHDFEPVLRDKNALVSLRQIIRELDEAQAPVMSPVIMNGSQFGMFANHSLVLANYISRANAAIIDLRKLLATG
jgi:hypothetical protein